MSKPTSSEYIRGSLYGLAAVSMWAAWIVAVRLGIRTSLQPWDITAIRFGVAGLILLPYLLKRGIAVDRLGWAGLAAIMVGGGAPIILLSYGGLLFAPAAHPASLFTALIPLYVAILAAVVLGEAFTIAKRIGLALIVAGVLGIVWGAGGTIGSRQNIGDTMFIGAGMLWACYTVALRNARLEGVHAAAIAVVGSLIAYVPVYTIIFGTSLFKATWHDLALQAFVHGFLVAVISLVLYGRAVSILGASNGSAFAALGPAITALLAIPILGEWPAMSDWVAMLLISVGVYIASGAPLPAMHLRTPRLSTARSEGPLMDECTPAVAVVRGAPNVEIQAMFRALADRWKRELRLAGVVAEGHGLPDRSCGAGYLRSLASGARFSILPDRGVGTAACHLDGDGALAAAAAAQRDIASGCDLVVLNKFGKLEAERNGLADAFRAALAAGLPLLISVSPAQHRPWRQFADRAFTVLPADPVAIEQWRRAIQPVAHI